MEAGRSKQPENQSQQPDQTQQTEPAPTNPHGRTLPPTDCRAAPYPHRGSVDRAIQPDTHARRSRSIAASLTAHPATGRGIIGPGVGVQTWVTQVRPEGFVILFRAAATI